MSKSVVVGECYRDNEEFDLRGMKLERTGAGWWKATHAVLRSVVLWEPQVLEHTSGVTGEAC